MTTDRPQLPPVQGLKRTSTLPPPPKRRTTPITAPTTAVPTAPVKTAAPRKPVRRPRSEVADVTRAISVSIPLRLAEAFKVTARSSGRTHADLLMDAVVANRDELDALIDNVRPKAKRDELFLRAPARQVEEPHVSLSLRMLAPNLAALDALVEEHKAESRSQLCAAVLEAYLPGAMHT